MVELARWMDPLEVVHSPVLLGQLILTVLLALRLNPWQPVFGGTLAALEQVALWW